MNILSGELVTTTSYTRRWWTWVENPDNGPDSDYAGKLTICLQRGKRTSSKIESDTYAVQETPEPFRNARGFLLLNITDPSQPDVYETVIGVNGLATCTCDAGRVGRFGCKHQSSLRALIEADGLPGLSPILPARGREESHASPVCHR